MYLSLNWLKSYTDIPENITSQQLSDKITLHTAEVEGFEDQREQFNHIVVGEIIKIMPHPDADKLQLAEINMGGEEPMTIVCGAPNIYEGMKVAFAGEGAQVRWHGEGDPITLKRTKIRGVESRGMACASIELGLESYFPEQDPMDIADFKHYQCSIGQPIADVLGLTDIILEVDNKSLTNRPDLFGHYGFARECATIFRVPLRPYLGEGLELPKSPNLNVDIKGTNLCRRITCLKIDNVKVEPSPAWLQAFLIKVGLRPINNLVDITNFVMYDLGQPLHAFDASKINGDTLIWDHPTVDTKVTTLDGEERTVTPEMLMIYDKSKPVSLGLIMGLENSEVDENTTSIILEASSVDPTVIRKSAQKLGIRTDASTRAEKNLDPEMTHLAIKRAAQLVRDCCPDAIISSSLSDHFPGPIPEIKIELSHDFLERRLGFAVETAFVQKTLHSLEFTAEFEGGKYSIHVPSHRRTKDVNIKEDIVEEIARMHGYDNIPDIAPTFAMDFREKSKEAKFEKELREYFAHNAHMQEVYNYSFVSEKAQLDCLLDTAQLIRIENPLSEDQRYLRTSMLPGIMENCQENTKHTSSFSMFEWGHVYSKIGDSFWNEETGLPNEHKRIAGVLLQSKSKKSSEQDTLFFNAKGILERAFSHFSLPKPLFTVTEKYETFPAQWAHPGKVAHIYCGKTEVGIIGALHPWLHNNHNLDRHSIVYFELDFAALLGFYGKERSYTPLPKYPTVERDLSLVVDNSTTYQELISSLKKGVAHLQDIRLVDIFQDAEKIGENKKSMSFRIHLRHSEKTLEEQEITESMKTMMSNAEKIGASLRGA